MSLLDSVETYIWGRADEAAFLRRVVEDAATDLDALLAKVQSIQSTLNVKLRQGVEANYPRLLEQVSAIESLNRLQLEFDVEMRAVHDKAEAIGRVYESNCAQVSVTRARGAPRRSHSIAVECPARLQLRADTVAWEQLVAVNRVLNDGLR